MSTAERYDGLVITQGEDFSEQFDWTDDDNVAINITGYSAVFTIRVGYHSPELVRLIDPTGITITGASGRVEVKMTDVATQALPTGKYIYTLSLIEPDGDARPFLHGTLLVQGGHAS